MKEKKSKWQCVNDNIFNKYLLRASYVPDAVLGILDILGTQTDKYLPCGTYILGRQTINNRHMKGEHYYSILKCDEPFMKKI